MKNKIVGWAGRGGEGEKALRSKTFNREWPRMNANKEKTRKIIYLVPFGSLVLFA